MVEGKYCCITGTNVKQSLYQMAGSKGGKHSKRKGKPIKSDTINKEPGFSNSKHELEHYLNIDDNASRDSEDKNLQPDINFALSTSRFSYTEHELEDFLHLKIELLYAKAKEELLKLGYSMATGETAIINAGYIHGQKGLLDNVLVNSLAYIENKVEPIKEAFKDMHELYECIYETMIRKTMQYCQCTQRSDAVWFLLISNWRIFPSTTSASLLRHGDENMFVPELDSSTTSKNEEDCAPCLSSDAVCNETLDPVIMPSASSKEIDVSDIVSSDFLRSIAGCSSDASLREWLESEHDDPKAALIVDLVQNIRELQEKIKEKKEWAEKKALDSERRVHQHLVELYTLRMEMIDKEKFKKENAYAEKYYILMLIEKEQSLKQANSEASFHIESMRMLEMDNAQLRADMEAFKLGVSEYEEDLREVLKREKRCMQKLESFEKQACILHSQIQEEKERLLQLEAELLQTDKEGDEVEKKWRHEIREKEHILSLIPEQIRMLEIQRANSRAELLKLQKNIEVDSQLPRDDLLRLEDELARLHLSIEKRDAFLQIDEASSSTRSGPDESCEKCIRKWMCMMCLKNEVSILFLPCKHQVVCSPCYSQSSEIVVCPYCSAQIEESINVYRPGACIYP